MEDAARRERWMNVSGALCILAGLLNVAAGRWLHLLVGLVLIIAAVGLLRLESWGVTLARVGAIPGALWNLFGTIYAALEIFTGSAIEAARGLLLNNLLWVLVHTAILVGVGVANSRPQPPARSVL